MPREGGRKGGGNEEDLLRHPHTNPIQPYQQGDATTSCSDGIWMFIMFRLKEGTQCLVVFFGFLL